MIFILHHLTKINKTVQLVGPEFELETFAPECSTRTQVLEVRDGIPKYEPAFIVGKPQPVSRGFLNQGTVPITAADCYRGRKLNSAAGVAINIIENHQASFAVDVVAVGKDVFINRPVRNHEVVQQEPVDLGENAAPAKQGEDLEFVPLHQPLVRALLPSGSLEFHAVLFFQTLDLTVPQHREPGRGHHQRRHSEVFVAGSELVHGGSFIGVGHEVDVAFENLRIEFEGRANELPVFGIPLVAEHVHECRVIDPVHSQGAHEVALEEPKSLRQQQSIGSLHGHPVDNFTPELVRHRRIEIGTSHREFGARRDGPRRTRLRKPQPVIMLSRQGHRSVESNHR